MRLSILLTVLVASTPAFAHDWPVHAFGNVTYRDDKGQVQPMRGAHVRLMCQNTLIDDQTAEGWTDDNGHFDLRGKDGHTWLPLGICDDNCTKPDEYIIIDLRNNRVEVETEIGFTWHGNTAVHHKQPGELSFGSFTFTGNDGSHAATLYGNMMHQYDNFTALTGQRQIPRHDGKINALFPALLAAGVPWTTEESIHWPGGESRWYAVYHEFGHRIRHAQDGDFLHFLGDVVRFNYLQQHWYDKTTNNGYAFNEGWAEYHSTMLYAGDMNTFSGWHVAGGDDVEGNVAAKLLALHTKCGGFKNMWLTLQSASIHSYGEFEAAMKRKFPSCFAAPPVAPVKKPLQVVKFTPLQLNVQQQMRNAMVSRVGVAKGKPNVRTLVPLAKVPADLKAHHAVVTRLHAVRASGRVAWRSAAQAAFKKHLMALKPITEQSAKSKAYLTERQNARHGFIQDAFGAQLKEIEKVMAEVKKERANAKNKPLFPHFDWQLKRYQARIAELKKALAQRPSPDMKIPVHLLPRAFGADAR